MSKETIYFIKYQILAWGIFFMVLLSSGSIKAPWWWLLAIFIDWPLEAINTWKKRKSKQSSKHTTDESN